MYEGGCVCDRCVCVTGVSVLRGVCVCVTEVCV